MMQPEVRFRAPRRRASMRAYALVSLAAIVAGTLVTAGCDAVLERPQPRLFYFPLSIGDRDIGPAFLDTGGEFEVLLSEPFGLPIQGELEVLAFGGREHVSITGPFDYTVAGLTMRGTGAIVGLSACVCNGVGLGFLQKAKKVVHLDFTTGDAVLTDEVPADTFGLSSARPEGLLRDFSGSFIEVEVSDGDRTAVLHALLDTGSTRTVMRAGIVPPQPSRGADLVVVTIGHPVLGVARVYASTYDTEGLPDMIIGTDLMGAWADTWCFDYRDDARTVWVADLAETDDPAPDGSAAR